MKILPTLCGCLLYALLACSPALAMDFAGMTNQELADLRGAIPNAPEADQAAFTQEWEKRQASMTAAEKKLFAEQEQDAADTGQFKKPKSPGRGYEEQGTGTIIYGGGGAADAFKGSGN